MRPLSLKKLLLAGVAFALGCQTPAAQSAESGHTHHESPSYVREMQQGSGQGGGGGSGTGADLAVPGMDFSRLTEPQRKELQNVFSDEFCYCGCPHTLGACLKSHGTCRHAKRMATLAARMAEGGFPSSEIVLMLSKYYDGFGSGRKQLKIDPKMCQGNEKAQVTLVEFFDYECPFCGAVHPVLSAFAKKYAAKIRFCVSPFALPAHPNAIPASQAALMARESGKFWQMHDMLFENQMSLSPEVIRGFAKELGMNADELGKAMASGKYMDEINALRDQAHAAAVDSTPTLFINGRKFVLDQLSEENLVHTIDDEMEWMANKGAWGAD